MAARLILVAFLLVGTSVAGEGQTRNAADSGQRVRVQLPCAEWRSSPSCRGSGHRVLEGAVLAQTRDTLWLAVAGTPVGLPADSIERVDFYAGRGSHFWAGAGVGAVLGGLAGGVIGSTQEWCILDCSPATGLGVLVGVPAGFLLGGIVGANLHSDRWRTSNPRRVTLLPRLDRPGVMLAATF